MHDDDLELVRSAIEALNGRDMERLLELLDPDVELVTVKAVFEGTEYRGHDGLRRYLADMSEDWERFSYELDSLTPVGDGLVLVTGRMHARGRETGTEVESPGAWLNEVRDGVVVSVHFYADADAALAAAQERAAH